MLPTLFRDLNSHVSCSVHLLTVLFAHSRPEPLHHSSKVNLSLKDAIRNYSSIGLGDLKLELEFYDTYILEAYIQSLVCGRHAATERFSKENSQTIMSLSFDQAPIDDQIRDIITLICKAFDAGIRGRTMAITSQGYIGAMPQEVQSGDLVCVLFGCSVPVVLRKRPDSNSYAFVGECYLHGFMDAEAIALHVEGKLAEQNFILS